MSSIEVRIPRKQRKRPVSFAAIDFLSKKKIVSPGDIITEASDYMRGHGTFVDDDKIVASVTGTVEIVNKLISVKPLKARYNGEVGDVVVGRIKEVGHKRWKVDTFSKLDSVLILSSVNLPGGELRRRSVQDELKMRDVLSEGDLISKFSPYLQTVLYPYIHEVKNTERLVPKNELNRTGALPLAGNFKPVVPRTPGDQRSQLEKGLLVEVSPSLIKRCKTHFHDLSCGVSVIIGNNGYIWIQPHEDNKPQGVTREDREMIARLRNCILALTDHRMLIYNSSLDFAVEASKQYNVKDLLKPEVKDELAQITKQKLEQLETES